MNAGRLPLFCDTALAERIERAEAQLIARASKAARHRRADTAGFVIPFAGGVASFAEEGSPFNKVAGLGFGDVPSAAALDQIEPGLHRLRRPRADRARPPRRPRDRRPSDRTSLPARIVRKCARPAVEGEPERVTLPGVEVRPSGDGEFEAWLDVVAEGFAHPDMQGVPSHEEFPRDVIARAERDFAAAGVTRYIALRDGVIAGGASFRMADGVAQLTGAATAPAHRRRGVQTALLSARFADAAAGQLRRRRRHHPAGVQVAGERAAPGLRFALHPRHSGEATLSPQAPPSPAAAGRPLPYPPSLRPPSTRLWACPQSAPGR